MRKVTLSVPKTTRGGSDASALPSRDSSCAKDAGRRREARYQPTSVGADKAYRSGEFLAWLLARDVEPHIPVIDRRHQTDGHFTRDQFVYDPVKNAYECPEGMRTAISNENCSDRTTGSHVVL